MEKAQVFVKIEEYKDMMDVLALTKERLEQAHTLLAKIAEIKHQEDAALEEWSRDLAEVSQLVKEIDTTLLNPEKP